MAVQAYTSCEYFIHAEKVPEGTHVYNYLEDVDYTTDAQRCIVLTGTVDEEWVVTEPKLCRSYTYADGTPIDEGNVPEGVKFEIRRIPGADTIYAKQHYGANIIIGNEWGDEFTCHDGDWIAGGSYDDCECERNCWVINGDVFANTYRPA